jgi:hypothetical protein
MDDHLAGPQMGAASCSQHPWPGRVFDATRPVGDIRKIGSPSWIGAKRNDPHRMRAETTFRD